MERIETLDPAGEGEPGRMQSSPRWASGTRKLTLPAEPGCCTGCRPPARLRSSGNGSTGLPLWLARLKPSTTLMLARIEGQPRAVGKSEMYHHLLPISARLIEGEDAAHGLPSVDLETVSGSLRGMTPN